MCFDIADEPLSLVFQYTEYVSQLVTMAQANKQFYRVCKRPNSWRFTVWTNKTIQFNEDSKYFGNRFVENIIGCMKNMPLLRSFHFVADFFNTSQFQMVCA